jgi:hypothetical protein
MESAFETGCKRNFRQCKSKDQNFKKQYYKKGLDLLQVALPHVEAFVKRIKRAQSKKKPNSASDLERMSKFDHALTRYKEFIDATKKQSIYEQAIQKLVNFEKSM